MIFHVLILYTRWPQIEHSWEVEILCTGACSWKIWVLILGLLITNGVTLEPKSHSTQKIYWCYFKMEELDEVFPESFFSSKVKWKC